VLLFYAKKILKWIYSDVSQHSHCYKISLRNIEPVVPYNQYF